jgi:hypothetical protein
MIRDIAFMLTAILIFVNGYMLGRQSGKQLRKQEARGKNNLRNMYNDIREFIKPDEDEQPIKGRKTPEQAEEDEKRNNIFYN